MELAVEFGARVGCAANPSGASTITDGEVPELVEESFVRVLLVVWSMVVDTGVKTNGPPVSIEECHPVVVWFDTMEEIDVGVVFEVDFDVAFEVDFGVEEEPDSLVTTVINFVWDKEGICPHFAVSVVGTVDTTVMVAVG